MLSAMEWIYINQEAIHRATIAQKFVPVFMGSAFKYKMTVIDTPDHVDFTPEVKNALCSFDGAALVLSSVDGVQSHSIANDKQKISQQLPRLVFIDNLDHKVADPLEVVDQKRSKFQHHSAALQAPIGLGYSFKGLVDLVQSKTYFFHASNGEKVVAEKVPRYIEALVSEKRHELIKTVSEVDDKLAEAFNGDKPISAADLQEAIHRATIAQKFVPVFMGSAFKYKGLQLLLDGVLNYLPCPTKAINEEKMSVIDTHAHVDFTAEVQNALPAFGSVLILDSDGVDGLQSHPIADDKQKLKDPQLSRLVFIRNLDQPGANPWQAVIRTRSKLQHHSAALQVPIGLGYCFKGLVDLVYSKAYFFHASNGEKATVEEVPACMEALVSRKRRDLIKTVSEVDNKLAEAFSSDKPISAADLAVLELLLDGVLNYFPCPTEANNYALIQSKNEEKTRSKLQHHSAALQVPIGLGYCFKGLVDLVHSKAYFFHASNGEKATVEEVPACMEGLVSRKRRDLIETVPEADDKLAEAFSSDKPISAADLEMTVIDTHDYVDFTAEVKNALPAFDGAVPVPSSVDEVQDQQISFSHKELPPSLRQEREWTFLKGILVALVMFLLFTPLSAQPAFDYYKLALQWVPGVLTATGICPATVVSRLLTIHGLWPSNKARPHPSGCPFVAYNSTKINSLKLDLGIAWPTIYGSDDDFWRRQWEKHGICSTFDQYHYFKHTLDIWKAHNVTLMLEDNGIVPGGKYDYGRIERTILKKTGSNPHITCTGNKYLGEIHLCFDAATPTNFVPCSSSGGSKCNTNPIEFVT